MIPCLYMWICKYQHRFIGADRRGLKNSARSFGERVFFSPSDSPRPLTLFYLAASVMRVPVTPSTKMHLDTPSLFLTTAVSVMTTWHIFWIALHSNYPGTLTLACSGITGRHEMSSGLQSLTCSPSLLSLVMPFCTCGSFVCKLPKPHWAWFVLISRIRGCTQLPKDLNFLRGLKGAATAHCRDIGFSTAPRGWRVERVMIYFRIGTRTENIYMCRQEYVYIHSTRININIHI